MAVDCVATARSLSTRCRASAAEGVVQIRFDGGWGSGYTGPSHLSRLARFLDRYLSERLAGATIRGTRGHMTKRTAGVCLCGLLFTISVMPQQGLQPVAKQIAQTPPFVVPASVRMLPDIAYRDGVESLKLDLFVPTSSKEPRPGVVFVACGGWIGGSKSQFWRQAAYLSSRGFVSVTTQCRYAPATRFPEQLNDAVAAVAWLRAHAEQYAVDPSRIAIAGASSGGHLAALVAMNRWDGANWSSASPSVRVQAAIIFNGVLDLFDLDDAPVVTKNATTFLGDTRDGNRDAWLRASPIQQVGTSAAPLLLLHGTGDQIVPFRQSAAMRRRLEDVGGIVELFTAQDSGHGFFNQPPWYEPTVAAVAGFLERVFR